MKTITKWLLSGFTVYPCLWKCYFWILKINYFMYLIIIIQSGELFISVVYLSIEINVCYLKYISVCIIV